jgi:RHS repeat-associated protein
LGIEVCKWKENLKSIFLQTKNFKKWQKSLIRMAVYENDGPASQLNKLCFKIKFYCTNIDDFVEREVCTDDFYLNIYEDQYHINSTFDPILDCDGNEISFSEIKVGYRNNRFEIVVSPTTNPPLIYSYFDFTMTFNGNTGLNLAEWHIWGSGSDGRVGIRRPEREKLHYFDDYINYPFPTNNFNRYIRYKDYELKDHLGNVRATITDLKLKDGSSRYKVDLSSANTYYPYGMLMPERNWSSEWYRYGFQGQEKDDEVKGEGNSIDQGSRIYNPRIVVWLKVDPRKADLPSFSPFSFAVGNPILYIDPDGEYPISIHVRAFAPFDYFGPLNLWKGDGANRKFSTSDASSKITMVSNYETTTQSSVTNAIGHMTFSAYGAYAYSDAYLDDGKKSISTKGNNLNFHIYGKNEALIPGFARGPSPLGRFSPSFDLDIHSKLFINASDDVLSISGTIRGDQFPSAEAFVSDSYGNSVFLGVAPTSFGPIEGPTFQLAGDKKLPMINVNIKISVDQKGAFQGVLSQDKEGNELMIPLDEWNEQFENEGTTSEDD